MLPRSLFTRLLVSGEGRGGENEKTGRLEGEKTWQGAYGVVGGGDCLNRISIGISYRDFLSQSLFIPLIAHYPFA